MRGPAAKPQIGISDLNREAVVKVLNAVLSDEYVVYTKTRKYHWNVTGTQFNDLHKFFESQYEALDEAVDEVAERARALGGEAFGTLTEFLKHTSLREQPGENPSASGMVADLLQGHEAIIASLREALESCAEDYGDLGTSDFLTGLMEKHEKMAWMLRAMKE